MNVILPFEDLTDDAQSKLRLKCVREGKTLKQALIESVELAMAPPSERRGPSLASAPIPRDPSTSDQGGEQ